MRLRRLSLVCLQLALWLGTAQLAHADPLLTYRLKIRDHEIRAEVAATEPERLRGLMFRDRLPENGGMIFVYPRAETAAMWMKNTRIALSVAFIDAKGRILNVADMEPFTDTPHVSAGPAVYALEMNHGWFKKRGIKSGDRVDGLQQLPPAQ